MRIFIDIDGVLCELRTGDQTYADVEPLPGAINKMKSLKKSGHYLILHTARHMKTCQGNVGLVIARQAETLLDWLSRHEIPYDEIHFGKPYADIYIDDNAFRFQSWDQISEDGTSLPVSHEKSHAKSSEELGR